MQMIKYSDPVTELLKIFEKRYPDKNATLVLAGDAEKRGNLGETYFGDDGKVFIQINIEQTLPQILDIVAHELAHLAAGPEEDHGDKWQGIYDWLFNEWDSHIEEQVKLYGGDIYEASVGGQDNENHQSAR